MRLTDTLSMKQILCSVVILSLAGCASSADLISETDGAWVNFRYSGGGSEVMYCTIKNSEGVPVCAEPRFDRIRRYDAPKGRPLLRGV